MKPLLPGALELPGDKYRLRIEELENENASLADKNASLVDKNASLANENLFLRTRIAELEQAANHQSF